MTQYQIYETVALFGVYIWIFIILNIIITTWPRYYEKFLRYRGFVIFSIISIPLSLSPFKRETMLYRLGKVYERLSIIFSIIIFCIIILFDLAFNSLESYYNYLLKPILISILTMNDFLFVLIFIWILYVITTLLHELFHIIVSSLNNVEVEELGIGILLGFPIFGYIRFRHGTNDAVSLKIALSGSFSNFLVLCLLLPVYFLVPNILVETLIRALILTIILNHSLYFLIISDSKYLVKYVFSKLNLSDKAGEIILSLMYVSFLIFKLSKLSIIW